MTDTLAVANVTAVAVNSVIIPLAALSNNHIDFYCMNSWRDLLTICGNEAGARVAFEKACLLTLQTKYKDENVHSVRLHQGDGGIDIYIGFLGVEPVAVYQCKFFISGINDSQKSQIRDSYRTASENEGFELKSWHLCLPEDLSIDEAKWFDGWASKQTTVKPQRVSPTRLLHWAEEAKVADLIFDRKDSQRIEEILLLVRGTEENNWRSVVENAEEDSAKILVSLIRKHIRSLNHAYPFLEELATKAEAGDQDAICEYTKSVPVSSLQTHEKVWFFNYLSDFTGEPILHRFIRRYKLLVDLAKEKNKENELFTTEFYSTYNAIISSPIESLRKAAFWPDKK